MLRALFWMVWRDLKIEYRRKQFVLTSLCFGILMVFLAGMALDAASHLPANWTSGLLWLIIFFSTSVAMNRFDHRDREFGGHLGALMSPVDRSAGFYAKWLTTAFFVSLSGATQACALFLMLNQPAPRFPWLFAGILVSGTVGLTGVGLFSATLAANSPMRDLLMPMMLFPLTIPLMLALIRLTEYTLVPSAVNPYVWMEVLVGYIVVFLVLPWLVYEWMVEV